MINLIDWPLAPLLEPLTYVFFRRALLASLLVGALCGLVGVYIVLRRMSYIGHGLSHAVFGGAVISYLLQWNFYLGAGLWGMASALLINEVAQRRKLGMDAAIGIVTTASFAIGVAGISHQRRFTRNFEAALFGNVLGITPAEPGYTSVHVAPRPGAIDRLSGTVPTPHGLVRVDVDGEEVSVDSPVPVRFEARDGSRTTAPAGRSTFTL